MHCFTNFCKRISFYSFIILLLFTGALDAQIPTDSLVAYYPFNGNANDESGYGNSGIVNGATLDTDRFGNLHSAYIFDGINDRIEGATSSLNYDEKDFSISVWIKADSLANGGIFTTHDPDSASYSNLGVYIAGSNIGTADIDINNGMGSSTNYSGHKITDNRWHHILISRCSNIADVYVDGELDFVDSLTQNPRQSNSFIIGSSWQTAYFSGLIDDIRIYAKALTQEETISLYHEDGWGNIFNLVSVTPLQNALGIAQNINPSFTVTTNIDSSTLTNSTVRVNGSLSGIHTIIMSYDSSTHTATITPDVQFKVGELVTITLTRGIQSTSGDSLPNSFSWSFTVKTDSATGTFRQSSTVSVGNNPWDVTVADFDGDGDIDAAVANYSSNSVSILKNDGSGLFIMSSTVIGLSGPVGIEAFDYDDNGMIDLAVTNSVSGSISLLKNNGTGVFTLDTTLNVGTNPRNFAVVDVDGNGTIDLAVPNLGSNTISILKNNGDGIFTSGLTVNINNTPQYLFVADIDNDGDIDLIVTGDNNISILHNDGSGVFTPKIGGNGIIPPTSYSSIGAFAVADMDGDGYVDIMMMDDGTNTVNVLKNNGSGIFTNISTVTVGNTPWQATTTDFDGDGDIDVCVGNNQSHNVSILMNNGSGVLTQTLLVAVGSNPGSIASADIDENGTIDLMIVNNGSQNVSILKNYLSTSQSISVTPLQNALGIAQNINPSFTVTTNIDSSTLTNSTVRVNGSLSGIHTIIMSYDSSTHTATITPDVQFKVGELVTITLTRGIQSTSGDSLPNSFSWSFTVKTDSATGTFRQSSTVSVGNNPWDVTVADFDGDGDIDAAVANYSSNSVSILKNDGSGLFTIALTLTGLHGPIGIKAADYDNDGMIDLAVTNSASNAVSIFKNSGSSTFTLDTIISVGTNPRNLVAIDINGDGAIDLAVPNLGSTIISILKNNGDGTFTSSLPVTVNEAPLYIMSADIDNDGQIDLIVDGVSTISILHNDGDGMFSSTSFTSKGAYAVNDMDGDGYVDILVVTDIGLNTVDVLKNNGNGTFTKISTVTVGNTPWQAAMADFDGDGDIDMCIGNNYGSNVSILNNNGSGVLTQTSLVGVGTNPGSIASADVDGNGTMDIFVLNSGSNNISILKNSSPGTSIRVSPFLLSFPLVPVGTDKSEYLKIYNDGTESSLIITNIVSSNTAFTVDRTSLVVPPISCDSILVLFLPTTSGITYNYNDSLMISSNDSVKPIIKVSIKAVPMNIRDVPGDNGRQVYLKWLTMGSPISFGITQFGIYRYDDSAWTYLTEIPALTDSIYQIIVPTLVDSTVENQRYWSSFKIIAFTGDPAIYTVIGPDSGYSIKQVFTNVDINSSIIPESFSLSQNYPNPFNPSTTIKYGLPNAAYVSIIVYNILGQQAAVLKDTFQQAGLYEVTFEKISLPSGIYFYQMRAGAFVETKKMILMK